MSRTPKKQKMESSGKLNQSATGVVHELSARMRTEEELRHAEERMRSVVDHVVDGIISIDERGRIEHFNPAAERLFGYGLGEVIGRNINILMPEPYGSEHDGYIGRFLASGQPALIGAAREVAGRRKDGSTFPMELTVSPYRIGSRCFFTGIVRDITERKRLEQELRQRLEQLVEADRQKNEFLAMLAHELRNPLASLRNAFHLMGMPGASAGMLKNARGTMQRQFDQLVRLADDLLDVARIVRGGIELRKERIDIAEAIARAMETVQPAIDAHGHVLSFALPGEALWVEADVIRLAQAIANLLTNAAKYSDPRGHIELSAHREDTAAVVRVRDHGPGIAPHLLPHIFELFVREDPEPEHPKGGLGVGLTLVRQLMELHGGTVTASSEGPGRGSVFELRLPALPREGTLPRPTSAALAASEARSVLKARILVVDDNVDAADSLAMILRLVGHDVQCVYHGSGVLEAALACRPDMILLDIGLPGMDGFEVVRQLRAHHDFERTRVVAVTGYGRDDDRRRAREAGFDFHLTKPVDVAKLQALIERPN